METKSFECPRCDGVLKEGKLHAIDAHLCPQCKGILVPQRDLRRLLDKMAEEMSKTLSLDDTIEAIPDRGGGVSCPLCGQTMDNYGYMGCNQVKIDSCFRCSAVWLDAQELGIMACLYARTKHHQETAAKAAEARSAPIVDVAIVTQAAERAVLQGWSVGRLL